MYIIYVGIVGPKDCVVRVGRMVSSATKTKLDTAKICYNEEEVFYPKHWCSNSNIMQLLLFSGFVLVSSMPLFHIKNLKNSNYLASSKIPLLPTLFLYENNTFAWYSLNYRYWYWENWQLRLHLHFPVLVQGSRFISI